MATVYWTGNGINIQGVDTLTVGGTPAAGNTITATINGKAVTYTLVSGDTTATAATGLFNLVNNAATRPPEFSELTWANPSNGVITATETALNVKSLNQTGGLTVSATGGGATITLVHTVTGSYQSDVGLAANWLRAGVAAIPANGDDVIVADSSIPLLWNLAALVAVQFASFRRWQSFTGTIGLPENNPAGYTEFRPTYFQFVGNASPITCTLGEPIGTGGGPSRERYNVGAQQVSWVIFGAGSPQDDVAIRILGTNASSTINLTQTSVGVAMLPGDVSSLASANVDGGGSLALGSGVTFSGALTLTTATAQVNCAPATVSANQGSRVTVGGLGLTYATVTVTGGSVVTWLSNSTITTLTLQTGSQLDKSQDLRAMTVTSSTIDADSCQIIDPFNAITYTNATTLRNAVTAGPFVIGATPARTLKLT